MERVRVRIGEPGQGKAVQEGGIGGGGGGGGDGGEAVTVGFDEDVADYALAGEPGQVGEPSPPRGRGGMGRGGMGGKGFPP